jgi:hypothetical protein
VSVDGIVVPDDANPAPAFSVLECCVADTTILWPVNLGRIEIDIRGRHRQTGDCVFHYGVEVEQGRWRRRRCEMAVPVVVPSELLDISAPPDRDIFGDACR